MLRTLRKVLHQSSVARVVHMSSVKAPINATRNAGTTDKRDTLTIILSPDDGDIKEHTLKLKSPSTNQAHLRVDNFSLLGSTWHSGIYRGVLNNRPVVLKIAGFTQRLLADLDDEATAYMHLLPLSLRGSVIPQFYGYFRGAFQPTFDGERCNLPIACIVLEDCGDALTEPFRTLPLADRSV